MDAQTSLGVDVSGNPASGCEQRLTRRQIAYQSGGAVGVELAEDVVEQQHRRAAGELTDDLVPGESQCERKRALLALRRLIPRVEVVDREPPVVSVRPDEREAAVDLSA